MSITRADIINKNNRELYSDFLNDFDKTPFGNQLGRTINEMSVNQSLKNLIRTNLGERLFQPLVGCNVSSSLFEMNDFLQQSSLELFIKVTIENNEPRVNLLKVEVSSSDYHNLNITLTYNLINNSDPITLKFLLKRVR